MDRKALRAPPPAPVPTPAVCTFGLPRKAFPSQRVASSLGGGHHPWDHPATSWGASGPRGALTEASLSPGPCQDKPHLPQTLASSRPWLCVSTEGNRGGDSQLGGAGPLTGPARDAHSRGSGVPSPNLPEWSQGSTYPSAPTPALGSPLRAARQGESRGREG